MTADHILAAQGQEGQLPVMGKGRGKPRIVQCELATSRLPNETCATVNEEWVAAAKEADSEIKSVDLWDDECMECVTRAMVDSGADDQIGHPSFELGFATVCTRDEDPLQIHLNISGERPCAYGQ